MDEDPENRRLRLMHETGERIEQARQAITEARARLEELRIEVRDRIQRVSDALAKERRSDDDQGSV